MMTSMQSACAAAFGPFRALAVALVLAAVTPPRAAATIDPAQAKSILQQAREICTRDGGVLWGHTLCGPMLLVDPDDRSIAANQADAGGVLKPSGSIFLG